MCRARHSPPKPACRWQVQHAAAEEQLLFPLSLASEGSCTIGGNLSTNAGGVEVLRYGMMRDLVLGLEVVLADGRVLICCAACARTIPDTISSRYSSARKEHWDVTTAALKLFPQAGQTHNRFCRCRRHPCRRNASCAPAGATGGLISAFELIPRAGLELVLAHIPWTRDPLAAPSPWYVLAEATSGAASDPDSEEALLGRHQRRPCQRCRAGRKRTATQDLWQLRENISEAQKREGASIKHDISVPVGAMPDFVARATNAVLRLVPGARAITFGHLGDGNLHFNFRPPKAATMRPFLRAGKRSDVVHEIVHACGGSISAEHGIGDKARGIVPLQRASRTRHHAHPETGARSERGF